MRDTSNLRAGLLRRHGKWLRVPINLGPSPAKKVCPNWGGEDPAPEVPALAMTRLDEGGPSASSAAPSDVVGSSATATVRADGPGPNSPAVAETPISEGVPDASNGEEASDEKSSHVATVLPSWEELMEMMKGLPCFMDAEAWLHFGPPESVVSYIQHLQEWTIPETIEVVNTSLLFFSCFLVVTTFPCNIVCCFVVALPRL